MEAWQPSAMGKGTPMTNVWDASNYVKTLPCLLKIIIISLILSFFFFLWEESPLFKEKMNMTIQKQTPVLNVNSLRNVFPHPLLKHTRCVRMSCVTTCDEMAWSSHYNAAGHTVPFGPRLISRRQNGTMFLNFVYFIIYFIKNILTNLQQRREL